MPVPVISQSTSILPYKVGEFFVYDPLAISGDPTSWAATGLPDGVSIDEETGRISGAATQKGVYIVGVTASNLDGTSEVLELPIGIEGVGYLSDDSIEIDVDLSTGIVSNPLGGEWILFGKRGDTLTLSIGFRKKGVLQDITLGQLNLAFKEFDPEPLLILTTGDFEKIGAGEQTRYQMIVYLDPDKLTNTLSNYEDDAATLFPAVSEIRWTVLRVPPGELAVRELERSSQNFFSWLGRDQIPDVE